MNILILNPPRYKGLNVIREDRCEIVERDSLLPPYSLAQLAAILRSNNKVELIDANCLNLSVNDIKEKVSRKSFDICVFRFTPVTYNEDMLIATLIKKLNKTITTVGICWTLKNFAPDILKKEANLDIYITGEPLITVPSLIEELKTSGQLMNVAGIVCKIRNEIVETNSQGTSFNYDDIPMPAYDLLPSLNRYYIKSKSESPYSIVQSSKGCPYRCIYCTVAKTKWNPRTAENILRELIYLKEHHNIRVISFFDETFTFDKERAIEICDGIIDNNLDIIWYCNCRSDKVDYELLKLMRHSGCRGISLGIESGSQYILDTAKKGTTVSQNELAISMAKAAKIKTYCSFMFGLPGETEETMNETIGFVKRTLPNGAQFNVVVPYPNTELYYKAIERGWIKHFADWADMIQHASIMRNDELNYEDIESMRKTAYRSLYFNPRWIWMNLCWVMNEPDSIKLACKYYLRSIINYVFNEMKYAH